MSGPDDGLRLRGGSGGTAVAVDDLRRAADILDRAADDLVAAGGRAASGVADPALAVAGAVAPSAGADVVAAATRLTGPRGPIRVAAALAATAAGARSAAAWYAGAEAAALAHVTAVGWWAGRTGMWVPATAVLGAVSITATREGPPGAAARSLLGTSLGAHAIGFAVAAVPATVSGGAGLPPVTGSAPDVARVVLAGARPAGHLREGPVSLVAPSRRVPPPGRAPQGVADLLAMTEQVASTGTPGGADPGTVRVTRLRRPSARGGFRTSWIVHVPGTQSWTTAPRAGATPFDLSGNVGLMAGGPTAGRQAVSAALRTAGVRSDEPVLLVGHSQGGLVAAAVAADPAVRNRYAVTHVVTAGSPVAEVAVPDDVRVLSLEHDDDLVPHLDGRPNPDRRTWLTVAAGSPSAAGGSLPPHDSAGYVATAAAVDRSGDADLVALRQSMSPFLDGPGVTVDAVDVRAVRDDG
jgi:hypothetical protein